jgi:hypothetical protein
MKGSMIADQPFELSHDAPGLVHAAFPNNGWKDNLQAKAVIVGDGVRQKRNILWFNPKEAKRQKKHRAEVAAFLERELDSHTNLKATRQWAIDLLASRRYKRYLKVTKAGYIRIDCWAIREAAKFDGKWVLEPNDDTISLEDAACGYKGLMAIERCFRSLKRTQIKLENSPKISQKL